MDQVIQTIYEKILSLAKNRSTAYYSDIAPLAGLDMSVPIHRERIGSILGEISRAEHQAGRPVLSAVVISVEGNRPGQGFFRLAEERDLYTGGDEDRFWVQELNRLFDYWS